MKGFDDVHPQVTVDIPEEGMMQVKLKILHGINSGREIVVVAPEFVVGRQVIRDLCPNSAFVSRRHCNIVVRDDQVTVLDLQSKNGTFVNGELEKDERVLEMGDVLRIGHVEFEVLIQRSAVWSQWESRLLRSPN